MRCGPHGFAFAWLLGIYDGKSGCDVRCGCGAWRIVLLVLQEKPGGRGGLRGLQIKMHDDEGTEYEQQPKSSR